MADSSSSSDEEVFSTVYEKRARERLTKKGGGQRPPSPRRPAADEEGDGDSGSEKGAATVDSDRDGSSDSDLIEELDKQMKSPVKKKRRGGGAGRLVLLGNKKATEHFQVIDSSDEELAPAAQGRRGEEAKGATTPEAKKKDSATGHKGVAPVGNGRKDEALPLSEDKGHEIFFIEEEDEDEEKQGGQKEEKNMAAQRLKKEQEEKLREKREGEKMCQIRCTISDQSDTSINKAVKRNTPLRKPLQSMLDILEEGGKNLEDFRVFFVNQDTGEQECLDLDLAKDPNVSIQALALLDKSEMFLGIVLKIKEKRLEKPPPAGEEVKLILRVEGPTPKWMAPIDIDLRTGGAEPHSSLMSCFCEEFGLPQKGKNAPKFIIDDQPLNALRHACGDDGMSDDLDEDDVIDVKVTCDDDKFKGRELTLRVYGSKAKLAADVIKEEEERESRERLEKRKLRLAQKRLQQSP